MGETLAFVDDGFLAKLSKHFGGGKYIKFDKLLFARNLARKENLSLEKLFYYTAPPFQSQTPTKEEIRLKENYDSFKKRLSSFNEVIFREGRVQRLRFSKDYFTYKQKAVDSLMVMDLMSIPLDYSHINKIILVACDSDFVPVIKLLSKRGIKSVLYTYYEKGRSARFSTSNELITSVNKYVKLNKEDFENAFFRREK